MNTNKEFSLLKIMIVISVLTLLIMPVNACTYYNYVDLDSCGDTYDIEPCAEYYYYINTYHPDTDDCAVIVDVCNPHNLIDAQEECFGAFGA